MFVWLSPPSSLDDVNIAGHLHSASASTKQRRWPRHIQIPQLFSESHLFSETGLGWRHLGEVQMSVLAPGTSVTSCLTNTFGLLHFHVVFWKFWKWVGNKVSYSFFFLKRRRKIRFIIFIYVYLCVCMRAQVQIPTEAQAVVSHWTGCWESNVGPLSPEPSLLN